jgi:hypothetical protein
MTEPTRDDLLRRLERLERRCRRLERAAGVGAVLVVAGLLVGASREPPRVVEAEKFVVRDGAGRERAMLGLDHPSSPEHSPVRLGLYNAAMQSSAVMYLSDAFGGVVVNAPGPEGKSPWSVQLFANRREGAGLKVETGLRQPAARVAADVEGRGRLLLQDGRGKVRFKAP